MKVYSVNGQVVVQLDETGDHKQRFIGMTVRQAHEHVTEMLEAINSAQGFGDAIQGKIKDPRDCPRCKARNITPRHSCKRVRG